MRFLTPNPPLGAEEHIVFQFTRWNIGSPFGPSQRKSLWRCSNFLAILVCKGKRDKRYVSKLDSVLLIRVKQPPQDKYIFFQLANLFFHFLNYPILNRFWLKIGEVPNISWVEKRYYNWEYWPILPNAEPPLQRLILIFEDWPSSSKRPQSTRECDPNYWFNLDRHRT
jgi:hypothetical protein